MKHAHAFTCEIPPNMKSVKKSCDTFRSFVHSNDLCFSRQLQIVQFHCDVIQLGLKDDTVGLLVHAVIVHFSLQNRQSFSAPAAIISKQAWVSHGKLRGDLKSTFGCWVVVFWSSRIWPCSVISRHLSFLSLLILCALLLHQP